MSQLVAHAVFQPPLVALEVRLEPGLFVFVGRPSDGTSELVRVLAGITRPARGSVRVGDRDPYADAGLRRGIAALLPEETLPPGATVGAAVERALRLRDQSATIDSVLEPFDLSALAFRATDRVSPEDARCVALALALAHPRPELMALHEPLTAAPAHRSRVIERLAELAASDVIVVCTTDSGSMAAELCAVQREALTPVLLGLRDGRLAQPLDRSVAGWSVNPRPSFVIRCSDPALLAAELSKSSAVTGCEWDTERLPGELCVSGPHAEATMNAVLVARRTSGVAISAVARREAWR